MISVRGKNNNGYAPCLMLPKFWSRGGGNDGIRFGAGLAMIPEVSILDRSLLVFTRQPPTRRTTKTMLPDKLNAFLT
jgi:hypothetical protein